MFVLVEARIFPSGIKLSQRLHRVCKGVRNMDIIALGRGNLIKVSSAILFP